jgi:hypothetical protein
MSPIVTSGGAFQMRAPTAVRPGRMVRLASDTSSGQWNPTDAGRMHSGQIGRLHRVHRTSASRFGCR